MVLCQKRPIKDALLKIYGRDPVDLDDLGHCCVAVINHNLEHSDQLNDNNRLIGFAWSIQYYPIVSNTHNAPEGHPTNWGHNQRHLPVGYPGFMGRVWVRYCKRSAFFSDYDFRHTLTHTGTGGYGSYDGPWDGIINAVYNAYGHMNLGSKREQMIGYPLSYDYKIFLADFPAINQTVYDTIVFNALKDEEVSINHYFLWNDPERIIQDKNLLKEIENAKRYSKIGI